jgi:hypothetical protein
VVWLYVWCCCTLNTSVCEGTCLSRAGIVHVRLPAAASKSAVLHVLCRDPYATFLAEYKRLRTHDYSSCSLAGVEGKACQGGHVSVISKGDFNATDFR